MSGRTQTAPKSKGLHNLMTNSFGVSVAQVRPNLVCLTASHFHFSIPASSFRICSIHIKATSSDACQDAGASGRKQRSGFKSENTHKKIKTPGIFTTRIHAVDSSTSSGASILDAGERASSRDNFSITRAARSVILFWLSYPRAVLISLISLCPLLTHAGTLALCGNRPALTLFSCVSVSP